jgi:hypothetical protein
MGCHPVVAGEDHKSHTLDGSRRDVVLAGGDPDAELTEATQRAGRCRERAQALIGGRASSR